MDSSQFEKLRALQERLSREVRIEPLPNPPSTVCAVDLHIGRDNVGFAAAVLVERSGAVLEQVVIQKPVAVPYVPGFLSFREMPLCSDAVRSLSRIPDVILVDGQGVAHPRRFGLACHLGIELDLPTVGVAKARLTGRADEPASERGSMSSLIDRGEIVGMVVRTRDNVRPLYVSVGHRITLDEAVSLTLQYATRYRLPDPNRLAHRLARAAASSDRRNN